MKRSKKIASIMLAVAVVISLAIPSFGASITIDSESSGHIFTAYQIFKATGTDEGADGLQNPAWGDGINKDEFLKAIGYTEKDDSAEKVADYLIDGKTAEFNQKVAKAAYKNRQGTGKVLTNEDNDLDKGYYLLVDEIPDLAGGNDTVYNMTLLMVTGDTIIKTKIEKPTVEKTVNGKEAVSDYNIGDDVPFKLTSKVPDMGLYDTYKYVFHDKLSNGLTFNEDSVTVTIGDTDLSNDQFKVNTTTTDGCTFEVELDLKTPNYSVGSIITVKYTATLNENASVGADINTNEVYLEYSNDPNNTAETGKTPEDIVKVYLFTLNITKVDVKDTNKVLEGAEFKLTDDSNKWAVIDADGKLKSWSEQESEATILQSDDSGKITVDGLAEGTYSLIETKAPDGYEIPKDSFSITISANGTNVYEVSYTITNSKGSGLPETGGIGTTIFYIAGGLLIAVAVVMLINKRKEKNAEK